MTRIVATTTLCALFLAAGFFTSNAVPGRQATIEDVATLRQMQPRSLSVWLQYLELQESGIEFAMQRRPEEFAKALHLYKSWPSNLDELLANVPETSAPEMRNYFTTGMLGESELVQLDAVIGDWMTGRNAAAEKELRSSLSGIAHARQAVADMGSLVAGRESKQRTIGQIVGIVIDVLIAQERGMGLDPLGGKGDRLPGASFAPTYGNEGKYATAEALRRPSE